MNNFFEKVISRFKEFWNRGQRTFNKKDSACDLSANKCSQFFDTTPTQHIFCGLPDYVYEKYLGWDNVKTKKAKHYLCLQNEFDPADFEVFKITNSFEEIVEKSKFSLCEDSDKVDIDFWLYDAGQRIKLKKKSLVVSKSFFKNKIN